MAFWPLLMAASAGLTLWGLRHDAWKVPAIAFLGYVAIRLCKATFPVELHEVAFGMIWIAAAAGMALCSAGLPAAWRYWPAFFYALAGLAYPVFLTFGATAGWLSVTSTASFICDILALISVGGGLYGLERMGNGADRGLDIRPYRGSASALVHMASGEAEPSAPD